MKKFLLLSLLIASACVSFAQNPVSWSFTSKNLGNNVFEVHAIATIQPGWHLYSQNQPEDAIAQPTVFNFNKNPLALLDGKVMEVGKLEKYRDEKLDISANQYSHKVDFIQKVKLKGKVKTNITGKLEYQTCDDQKCLPPKTVNFTISLS